MAHAVPCAAGDPGSPQLLRDTSTPVCSRQISHAGPTGSVAMTTSSEEGDVLSSISSAVSRISDILAVSSVSNVVTTALEGQFSCKWRRYHVGYYLSLELFCWSSASELQSFRFCYSLNDGTILPANLETRSEFFHTASSQLM